MRNNQQVHIQVRQFIILIIYYIILLRVMLYYLYYIILIIYYIILYYYYYVKHHLTFVNCLNVLCTTSFKKHLPEEGHDRWPKRVGGHAVCNTINVQTCISTRLFLISSSPCFTSW
jgi:hypothetical protein